MLQIRERAPAAGHGDHPSPLTLTLAFDDRQRSRLRVTLSSGEEAAMLLARGSVLRGGDHLMTSDQRRVLVTAARESVSTARSGVAQHLARVAYHLGNRHVALEIGADYVRYLHDHVLDDMVRELGVSVAWEQAPFEPEAGAYASRGKTGHAHGHAHGHGHAHEQGPDPQRGYDHEYGYGHVR